MTPCHALRGIVGFGVAVSLVAQPGWVRAQGSTGPAPSTVPADREDPDDEAADEGTTEVPVSPPPLRIAGTVIAPPTRAALVVLQDDRGREAGSLMVDEGDSVAGYRLVEVQPNRVSFERDGRTFWVGVGRPGSVEPGPVSGQPQGPAFVPTPTPLAPRSPTQGTWPVQVGPPPADVEEIQRAAGPFLEQLVGSPEFQNSIEELPLIRQQREQQQGERPQPDAPPPAPVQP